MSWGLRGLPLGGEFNGRTVFSFFVVECGFATHNYRSAMILRFPKSDSRDVLQTTPMCRTELCEVAPPYNGSTLV